MLPGSLAFTPGPHEESSVIARMWHGKTLAAKADEYLAFLQRRALPDYRSTPGNLAAFILRRADGGVTHFTSRHALGVCAGDRGVCRRGHLARKVLPRGFKLPAGIRAYGPAQRAVYVAGLRVVHAPMTAPPTATPSLLPRSCWRRRLCRCRQYPARYRDRL